MATKNIAILASGNGSNAENIIHHFRDHSFIDVALIVTNNQNSGVIERGNQNNIPVEIIGNSSIQDGNELITVFEQFSVDFVILAGFLKKVPSAVIQCYENKIINIHPSLLPKYGGKGMFGMNVHRAVIENKESHSGITIHLVNENYDEGRILNQFEIDIIKGMTPELLQEEIQQLEKKYFPSIIEQYIKSF
jgi:phosphoribosylglycinamide formyltransferase-1